MTRYFVFFSDYYECNDPLLDRAQLSATSSLPDRGPENARLDGTLTHEYKWFVFTFKFRRKDKLYTSLTLLSSVYHLLL